MAILPMFITVPEAIDPIDTISRPTNLKEAWEQYKEHLQATLPPEKAAEEIRSTQTALFRYTLPGWGGPAPLSERLSPIEISTGMQFAESVSLVQFQAAVRVLETVIQQLETDYPQQQTEPDKDWKKYFQGLRKRSKHYLNKFWDWVNEQGWFEPTAEPKQQPEIYRFNTGVKGRTPLKEVRLTERTWTGEPLQALPKEQKSRADVFALGKVEGDEINPDLQAQLDKLRNFMVRGGLGDPVREISADEHIKQVLQILGWFHRVKGIPFADLRLETLVPFTKLRPNVEEIEGTNKQWAIQSGSARIKAKQLADRMEDTVHEHLSWRDTRILGNPKLHYQSKLIIVYAWIAVAKYVYRLETDQDESDHFKDVPAVRRLRKVSCVLTKQGKNAANVVDIDKKMVPWIVLLSAVERLRLEADLERLPINGQKRPPSAQAKSKQRFLLLSLMTILPPDRQRTYRELEKGKTLVKGQLKGSKFTSVENMADPQNAKWYIHLEAPDYKTGDAYGPWWGEVPNVVYPDGKTFYGYIDEWLNEWRQTFNPNHQYFFTRPNGTPMTAGAITQLVKGTLYRLLGVPVTPHVLRDMFVTHLYEQEAPGHVLDSAALAMHHSQRMQAKSYNRQEQADKLQPSFSYAQKLVQQVVKPKVPTTGEPSL